MPPTYPNGEVPIALDRPRKLKFNHNALCLLEQELGVNVFTTPNVFALGARAMRALLFAALRHEDASLTLERAGNFFDCGDEQQEAIVKQLARAWRVGRGLPADPTSEETAAPDPNAESRPTQPAQAQS